MRLSITITDYNWTAEGVALPTALRNVVRAADESSIDTVWVADHLLQSAPGTVPTDPYLEAYATLGSSRPPANGCGSVRSSPPRRSASPRS